MRGCSSLLAARRPVALLSAAALATLLATGGAAAPSDRVSELLRAATSIDARERAATLELYALESQLAASRARLGAITARREAAEAQLASLRIQLDAAWQSAFVADERLEVRLRKLYVAGGIDPVAVLLGSESLDEAISGLEGLRSLASGDRDLVRQVRAARAELTKAKRRIAARAAALEEAEAAARATTDSLAAAREQRRAYLAQLAAERGLNDRRIARAQRIASRATARSAAPAGVTTAAAAPGVAVAPVPAEGGRTLTVEATGYALRGTTATGIPTAWGVVAVDPSVIPLGTRMTIPGYGEGVAADTGGAVRGATIDLWFPTVAEALSWGRRTVTITLH